MIGDSEMTTFKAGIGDAKFFQSDRACNSQRLNWRTDVSLEVWTFLLELRGESAVADKHRLVTGNNQGGGVAGEAGQIANVDGMGDQEGIEIFGGQQGTKPFATGGIVSHAGVRRV